MSSNPVRVPQIKSEIAVAVAFVGWSLRQLADYAATLGRPFGEHFLEDALEEPWPGFRDKADPVQAENLSLVLGALGVGLHDSVFGAIKHPCTRVPADTGLGQLAAAMTLVANYPKAQLRLAVQESATRGGTPAVALLINPGNRYLLCDAPDLDPGELVSRLYASCLDRLWVAERRISPVSSLSPEDAITRLLKIEVRPASNLSKGRVADLARVEA